MWLLYVEDIILEVTQEFENYFLERSENLTKDWLRSREDWH